MRYESIVFMLAALDEVNSRQAIAKNVGTYGVIVIASDCLEWLQKHQSDNHQALALATNVLHKVEGM
jgi:hypothetical protein